VDFKPKKKKRVAMFMQNIHILQEYIYVFSMVATMVVENGQSVVCKLIPQMQRQLGLAVLGFRRPWLVRGSSVVEIGLCTLDLYWDPLARAIVLRPLDRGLWADTGVVVVGQLAY